MRKRFAGFGSCHLLLPVLLFFPSGAEGAALQDSQVDPLWGASLIAKIDSVAGARLTEGPVASLGIGVKRGDDVLLVKGYGLADIENQVSAKPETVYRIGSITKQFTAAAVMQLVEAGEAGLDDSMTDYFPDYPTQGHEVTVRHLLTHTSGIKSYTGLETWQPKITLDLTDQELMDLFKDEPFDFEPGEAYRYNNSGFYLLGMLIEKVTSESYKEYVKAHLFEPLGLGGTLYCDERPIIPWRAEGYSAVDGSLVNDSYLSMNQPGAAGALCSTVPDLLAWSEALRSGEVVSSDSYGQMTTSMVLNDGSETGYGFGLGVRGLEGHPQVSHGGGINGFVTMLAHFPEADLDIVVLSNTESGSPGEITELIARWALGIEVPSVLDEPLTGEEMAVYEGVYELREGFEITVFAREGELFTRATGQNEVRLRAQGNHVFVPTFDDEVRVVFEVEGGSATKLILHQNGVVEAPRIR